MRLLVVIALSALPAAASAQNARPKQAGLDTTIARGLGFLVKDALAWKKDHNCASCHHASLVICALREAKQSGRGVDEPVLAELTKWVAESGNGKFGMARPASAPKAASPKAIYFALALGANPMPDEASQKGLKLLLKTVAAEQTENGSWSAWPETRPPLFGSSDESLTALATLAVLPVAASGNEQAKVMRDKGIKWLAETKTDDDPQSIALRLVLWERLNRPAKEWQPLVKRIKDRQNADGGWSQTKKMPSDAWATGQALYALAHAGIKPNEPAIARGQAFLIKTQRQDGSWSMTSRPTKPGGKGSESLIPITGAGSAWAVLGLVRSAGLGPGYDGAQAQRIPAEYKRVIEKSLDWLANKQNKDGSWPSLDKQSDVTCTGVAGLALLMEGSTGAKGTYAENIKQALAWMVQNCKEGRDDGLFGANAGQDRSGYMIGQSYAVLFLASSLTREEKSEAKDFKARLARLRRREAEGVLKRAVQFIVKAQTKSGGWGLISAHAGEGEDNAESTLQQLLALRAARQAGVDVPKETMQNAYSYLKKMTTPRGGISFSSARAGGERPGLTIAAFAATYGSDQIDPNLLKKWLKFSQYAISPRSQTQDHFYLAVAVHGLGNEGYAKLFRTTEPALVWSKARGILLARFHSGGGVVYREWNPSPIFGTAISLIALQLDNEYLPIFRMKKNW